jgi:hypothetical protein
MSSGVLVDGMLVDGKLGDGVLAEGTLFEGVVTGVVEAGTVAGTVVGVLVGVVTAVVGAADETQSGSPACSASSQLPRTSPGTPLSSGVPASRDAAIAGTAKVSVAQPAMIQMRCRFMGSSSCWGTPPSSPLA